MELKSIEDIYVLAQMPRLRDDGIDEIVFTIHVYLFLLSYRLRRRNIQPRGLFVKRIDKRLSYRLRRLSNRLRRHNIQPSGLFVQRIDKRLYFRLRREVGILPSLIHGRHRCCLSLLLA